MIIEGLLRLMRLVTSMLLMIGVVVSFRECRRLWEEGVRFASVTFLLITFLILLLAALSLAITLFADFC